MKTTVRLIGLVLCTNLPAFSYSDIVEEIVVTAQEREHNVQEVGITINALTGDQLGLVIKMRSRSLSWRCVRCPT